MKFLKPMLLLLSLGSLYNPLQSQAPANRVLMMIKFGDNVPFREVNASKIVYEATQLDSTVLTNVKLWSIPIHIANRYGGLSGTITHIEGSYNANGTIRASADSLATIRVNDPEALNQIQSCFNPVFSPQCISAPNYASRVAILDAGLDTTDMANRHPDLKKFFNKNLSRNCSTIGNGADSLDIQDRVGHHGAIIADIIGQVWSRNGLQGMSRGQEILMFRIFDSVGKASQWSVVKGLEYALKNRVDVINMSINWQIQKYSQLNKTSILQQIFWQLAANKILVIASSGNNNPTGRNVDSPFATDSTAWLPGNLWYGSGFTTTNPNENPLLTVAATTCNDTLATFSNFGTTSVKATALGTNIPARDNAGIQKYYSGTSMSAAIISGLASMRLARFPPAADRLQSGFWGWLRDDCGKYRVGLRDYVGWSVTLLSENEDFIQEKLHLNVFPNPVKSDIHLTFDLETKNTITLQLQDLFGRVVLSKTIEGFSGANEAHWELPPLATGLYVLSLRMNQTVVSRKISLF